MITVEKEPGNLELSGSYLPLWLSSDNEYASQGSTFKAEMEFSAIPADGSSIELRWLDYEVKLEFSSAPGPEAGQVDTGAASLDAWLQNNLLPALQGHFEIEKYFEVEKTSGTIVEIMGRDVGTDYRITFVASSSANFTEDVVGVGTDPQRRDDFSLLTIVDYAPLPKSTTERHEKRLQTVKGTAYFELSEPLRHLHRHILPDFGQSGFKDISANVLKYRCRFCENYDVGTYSHLQEGSWKYLLPGGRSKQDMVEHPDFLNKMIVHGAEKDYLPFLTHTEEKMLSKNQPLLLNYMCVEDIDFRCTVRVFYSDGTEDILNIDSVQNPLQYGLYVVEAGYMAVAAVADASKEITAWRVYMRPLADGQAFDYFLSNQIICRLDTKHRQDELFLLYRNSFGVDEIYRATGTISYSTQFQKTRAKKMVKYPESLQDRLEADLESNFRDLAEINTGHMGKAEIARFRDVLNSTDVYLMDGGWIPVSIEPADLSRGNTHSGRANAHNFVVRGDIEKYYS